VALMVTKSLNCPKSGLEVAMMVSKGLNRPKSGLEVAMMVTKSLNIRIYDEVFSKRK
jgi:hypothetical protein